MNCKIPPYVVKTQSINFRDHEFLWRGSFVSQHIREKFKSTAGSLHTVEWDTCKINIYMPGFFSVEQKFIEKIVFSVCFFTAFLGSTPRLCTRFEYTIFPCTLTKQLPPSEKECFTEDHINTGSTYRGNCQSILIWRLEEMIKTIFHESIHSLSLEFDDTPSSIKKEIMENFAIDTEEIRLYESYVEFLAEYINVHAYLAYVGLSETMFDSLWEKEKQHCFQQCGKILRHAGFSSWSSFQIPTKKNVLKQTTSVFSYFIVRSALYFNPYFLQRLSRTRDFVFYHVFDSVESYWTHIKTTFSDPEYVQQMDFYIQQTAPSRSLRMTALLW